jgi:hypothetical protein
MPIIKNKKFTIKDRLAFYQTIANKQADIIANVRVSLGADEEVPAELLGDKIELLIKENKRLKGKLKK